MGKSSGSGSNTATKQARSSSTGAEGGGGQEAQTTNSCLFAFTERFTISAGAPVKVGDTVALVPDASNAGQLDIIIGSGRYGHYAGQHLQKLLKCISDKYSYTGTVDTVTAASSGVDVVCTIRGHSYEQPSTTV